MTVFFFFSEIIQLKEYQRYLDRRHKSLNEKEQDLCVLQDVRDILHLPRADLDIKIDVWREF